MTQRVDSLVTAKKFLPRNGMRGELEQFARNWGLERLVRPSDDDKMGNTELLHSYLACSTPFCDWTRVYEVFPPSRYQNGVALRPRLTNSLLNRLWVRGS